MRLVNDIGPDVTITGDMMKRYQDAEVDELITYGEIPSELSAIKRAIEQLAEKLIVPAEKI